MNLDFGKEVIRSIAEMIQRPLGGLGLLTIIYIVAIISFEPNHVQDNSVVATIYYLFLSCFPIVIVVFYIFFILVGQKSPFMIYSPNQYRSDEAFLFHQDMSRINQKDNNKGDQLASEPILIPLSHKTLTISQKQLMSLYFVTRWRIGDVAQAKKAIELSSRGNFMANKKYIISIRVLVEYFFELKGALVNGVVDIYILREMLLDEYRVFFESNRRVTELIMKSDHKGYESLRWCLENLGHEIEGGKTANGRV